MTFSGAELEAATGGSWRAGVAPRPVAGVFTDTRQPGEGLLFLALAGEKFDAHDFLDAAIASGCSALCIERSKEAKLPPECPVPVLLVGDAVRAYQDIARFHRLRFPELVVAAVTGSVGKTSVKEMLRAVFCAAAGEEHVLYTVGNTNNQIGVPQNLLRLTPEHRYAVIEMGTNHHGEIGPLSRCACPGGALVNAIAPCHLEFLGSLAGVAREKGCIFRSLAPDGTAVIPAECPACEVLEEAARPFRVLRFGETETCDVKARYLGGTLEGSSLELVFPDGGSFRVKWRLSGRHQAVNAAAAAATAFGLGIAPEVIARGLGATQLPGMRSRITRLDGVTYLNDAYNANPGSMRSAFEHLAEFADPAHLVLVLGEMRELGESSASGHREIYELARRMFPAARILTVGAGFAGSGSVEHYLSAPEAAPAVLAAAHPGSLVFAKGSRGIAAELALPEAAR